MPHLTCKGPPPLMVDKATNTGVNDNEVEVSTTCTEEQKMCTEEQKLEPAEVQQCIDEDKKKAFMAQLRKFFGNCSHINYSFQLEKRVTANVSIQTSQERTGRVNPPPNRRTTKQYNMLMLNHNNRVVDQFTVSKKGFYTLKHSYGDNFVIPDE